jgi:hypothetical protein
MTQHRRSEAWCAARLAHTIHPLVLGQDAMVVVPVLVVGSRGRGVGLPHDVVPELIRHGPLVCQVRADRAPEGAVSVAEDA